MDQAIMKTTIDTIVESGRMIKEMAQAKSNLRPKVKNIQANL